MARSAVRTLIAQHFGVAVERVTDEAHFADDLGADWLDRIELMIVIEDQFAGVEITAAAADQRVSSGKSLRSRPFDCRSAYAEVIHERCRESASGQSRRR